MSGQGGLFGGQPGLFDGEPLELRSERIDRPKASTLPLRGFLVCQKDDARDGWRPAEGVLARTMADAVDVALMERGWRSAEWTHPHAGVVVGRGPKRHELAVIDPNKASGKALAMFGTTRDGRRAT